MKMMKTMKTMKMTWMIVPKNYIKLKRYGFINCFLFEISNIYLLTPISDPSIIPYIYTSNAMNYLDKNILHTTLYGFA